MYIWFTWNNLSLFILIRNKIIYITLYIDTIMDNTGTSILIIKKDTNILLSLGRGLSNHMYGIMQEYVSLCQF